MDQEDKKAAAKHASRAGTQAKNAAKNVAKAAAVAAESAAEDVNEALETAADEVVDTAKKFSPIGRLSFEGNNVQTALTVAASVVAMGVGIKMIRDGLKGYADKRYPHTGADRPIPPAA